MGTDSPPGNAALNTGWFKASSTGLTVHLRVTPNAGRDAIDGVETRDDGTAFLRVRVSAVPDKGKANAAVLVLLGKALGVPKSAILLVSGDTSRMKTFSVAGDAILLAQKATALVPLSDRHPRA